MWELGVGMQWYLMVHLMKLQFIESKDSLRQTKLVVLHAAIFDLKMYVQ